jgi:hypothetical protein
MFKTFNYNTFVYVLSNDNGIMKKSTKRAGNLNIIYNYFKLRYQKFCEDMIITNRRSSKRTKNFKYKFDKYVQFCKRIQRFYCTSNINLGNFCSIAAIEYNQIGVKLDDKSSLINRLISCNLNKENKYTNIVTDFLSDPEFLKFSYMKLKGRLKNEEKYDIVTNL